MSKVLKSCFIFVLFIQTFFLEGQIVQKLSLDKSQHYSYAQTLIKDLKSGYLIVRLRYNQAQINNFNNIIIDQRSSPKDIKSAKAELNRIIKMRDTFNFNLMSVMDSVYKFSNVRYIYDKDYSIKNVAQNNHSFLNRKMKVDPILAIGDSKFLVFGYLDFTTSSGRSIKDFRVLTPDFTEVPEQIQISGSNVLVSFILDYGKSDSLKATLIKKLVNYQIKLQKFYNRAL